MTDPDLSQQFNWLQAEIDALRARNDVLTTALKYTVKSSPQAARLIALIEKELHEAKVSATLSGVPSNVYRDAFAAASGNVSKWCEVPPPVDHCSPPNRSYLVPTGALAASRRSSSNHHANRTSDPAH